MVKNTERETDAAGAGQSKKPTMDFVDSADQLPQQPQQQPHPHHRVNKSQKHIVGGGTGGRLHIRVPSSKGLHKHHAAPSTAKLNRRHGSLSPDRETGLATTGHHHHRRATSDLKLARDPSHTNLRRNRSQVDTGKRTKSTTSLHRSVSNPAVNKLKSSGSSRVHFNLGDDDQDEDAEDEWVDASTSASPLLSRRGSAVAAQPSAGDENPGVTSPTPRREDTVATGEQGGTQSIAHSLGRDANSHNQYLTSRILSRTSLQGAPPKMSTETVSVRPSSSRQQSPLDSSMGNGPSLSETPGTLAHTRPGSSGKAELTSRFVGHSSQESGSGIPGDSFMLAANRGGVSRAALSGLPRRQSMASLPGRLEAMNGRHDETLTDDEDVDHRPATSRTRRSGDYVVPRDMNRTQQKLNLQRASSTLEPAHPHPAVAGVGVGAGTLAAGLTYDSEERRRARMLERTGMEYLTVRRHMNPIARSIARVMQLPGVGGNRQIQQPGGRGSHPARAPESGGSRFELGPSRREGHSRDPSMVDLLDAQAARRPPTPGRASSGMTLASASSSLGTDDGVASRMHDERHGLSGASLVDGTEDAGTVALLRMMWEKRDPGASQD